MDATDKEALKSLGLEDMNGVIVSTGTKISISILICLHLHEIGVKKILAKALDDDHAKILKRVGATQIIHPERDMAVRISKGLSRPNVMDFIPLSEEYDLVQVRSTSRVYWQEPPRLEFKGQVQCACHRHQRTGSRKLRFDTAGKLCHKGQRYPGHAGQIGRYKSHKGLKIKTLNGSSSCLQ